MSKLYENVFRAKHTLYAREYDTETKTSEIKPVKYVPSIYLPSKNETKYKSIITKEYLQKLDFKNMSEFREQLKVYEASGVNVYGSKSEEQGYIRETYGDPVKNDHEFRTLFLDIETAVLDKETPRNITKNDWKPEGERAAMASITSIQMYDTKSKQFFIIGLKKKWVNRKNFKSNVGKINYIQALSEEELLKTFLKILNKINPTVIAGWNSEGYDYPYITMRIIRVLDKETELFSFNSDKKTWDFNRSLLNGGYVSQLSPVGSVTYRPKDTTYGITHTFQWLGYILEDYMELYDKYTYVTLTSKSLSAVATHELGDDKVAHDEFSDFAAFYEGNYKLYDRDYKKEHPTALDKLYDELIEMEKNNSNSQEFQAKALAFQEEAYDLFIEYGIMDVELLDSLNKKLKLIDLAKYLAYFCGVSMPDVKGTVKQWNSFVYNEAIKQGYILPIKNTFPKEDDVLLRYAASEKYQGPNKERFTNLYNNPTTRGQKFPGGWTRGTSKFWKWVFSLDFTSLYPSVQMFANIGIDTLIEPKDLPEELLNLRAKYFIYYGKDTDPKDYQKLDYKFIREVLDVPEVREEIHNTLVKYNVSATPNGMFFRKEYKSIMSVIINRLISIRKTYKKDMKQTEQFIENLKVDLEEIEAKIASINEEISGIDNEITELEKLNK